MSQRPKKINLPLRNISSVLNARKMSYSNSSDSGFTSLTNSPMSNLAFNLSELSTGRTTPRRRLSLSSLDTPPNDCDNEQNSENIFSAESGCFSNSSSLADSPTLESLSLKRIATEIHPDIPLEAFSLKKKTIAFRRISSQPLPSFRLDSPTGFLEENEENDENSVNRPDDSEENENSRSQPGSFCDDASSQDSGLGLDHDRRVSVASSDDGASLSSPCDHPSPLLERLPSLEDVWNDMHPASPTSFKEPKGKPPKRTRSLFERESEETCSPHKYSPVKASSLPLPCFSGFAKSLFSDPETISSPSPKEMPKKKTKPSFDDGFQELFDIDDFSADLKTEANDQVSSLISATLLHKAKPDKAEEAEPLRNFLSRSKRLLPGDQDDTPNSSRSSLSRRTLLQRSQSMVQPRSSFKRCEPPHDNTPVQSKRWRGNHVPSASTQSTLSTLPTQSSTPSSTQSSTLSSSQSTLSTRSITDVRHVDISQNQPAPVSVRRFQRCHSETEAIIKSAVSRMYSEPDLIADSSRPYLLPTTKGKHQDLKSITPETMSRVLANEYSDEIEECHIIDCRYPYEFEGGHIQNALNIYTKEQIVEKYLKSPMAVKDPSKRLVLIFHCEFSSERGPGLFRFLRRLDREKNKECYPFLHYPEIYLLEGGYKCFFEQHSNLCEPQTYLQMLDKKHSEDFRKFRAKCKTWSDERSQSSRVRPLKF